MACIYGIVYIKYMSCIYTSLYCISHLCFLAIAFDSTLQYINTYHPQPVYRT